MNWRNTSFNTMTAGDYAVTKTAKGYYAWCGRTLIRADPFESFDAAKVAVNEREAAKKAAMEDRNG